VGIVPPVASVEVAEYNTPNKGKCGVAISWDFGVECGIRSPKAEEELCRPMIIMCNAMLRVSKISDNKALRSTYN